MSSYDIDELQAAQSAQEVELKTQMTRPTSPQNKTVEEWATVILEEVRRQDEWLRQRPTRKEAYAYLGKIVGKLNIPLEAREPAITSVLNDMYAYGKLQAAMDDPYVSDIQIYGDHGTFIYKNSKRTESTEARMSNDELFHFIVRKLAGTPYRFDLSNPRTDAILADGSRLHVRGGASGWTVTDEEGRRITKDCIIATIRKPLYPFALDDLQKLGSMSEQMMAYLEWVQRIGEGFVIGGDVGSGKSTLMAAMIGKSPAGFMSCVMEEMPELQPLGEWVGRLYTRAANAEGKGEIDMAANLVDTLRMFYDNVYVGETRTGDIAFEFLQTGLTVTRQTGTTTHATEGVKSVIERFALLALGSSKRPSIATVGSVFTSAIHHIITTHKTAYGKRITEIGEILPFDIEKRAIPYTVISSWDPIEDKFDFKGCTPEFIRRAFLHKHRISTLPIQKEPKVEYVYLE